MALSKRAGYVKFTDDMVQKLSGGRYLDGLKTPLVLGYGTTETPEFQRQSRDFAAAVKAAGKPVELIEGLAGAAPDDLADIEVTPAGLGLHWPKLDADVYVPALMQGVFGSRRWMAAQLGATGGKATSKAKGDAARANGRKGGRRPKTATA